MEWEVDYNEPIPFLGKTIYRPENVLIELCANSYDADASRVEIKASGESGQVLIKERIDRSMATMMQAFRCGIQIQSS